LFTPRQVPKEAGKAESATQRRVKSVQRLPRISQSVPPNQERTPLIVPQTPSHLEDFIPRGIGEVTRIIVDQVQQVTTTAKSTSLRTFDRAFSTNRAGDSDEETQENRGHLITRSNTPRRRSSSSQTTIIRQSPQQPLREAITPPIILPVRQANMTTCASDIKVKDLIKFNGTPSDLEGFDASLSRCLLAQNLPLYYGGWVQGERDSKYEYVAPNAADSKSNYQMGKRLYAAVATKFEGVALTWWDDYDGKQGNPLPNCWKKHESRRRGLENGNGTTVEVSLYELIKSQFSGEIDARTAEIELGKFR